MRQRWSGSLDESAVVSSCIPHANIKIMNILVWAQEAGTDSI
jgi:hypothetical protein